MGQGSWGQPQAADTSLETGVGEAGLGHWPVDRGQDQAVDETQGQAATALEFEGNLFEKTLSEAEQLA